MLQFTDFGLAAPILKSLEALGYKDPTPIQKQAIPIVLHGKDLLGIAQTGTGKTAAFTLPILHHLNLSQKEGDRTPKSVRGLILAPTRELALQIAESVREYGKYLGLKVNVVLGGVSIDRQIKLLAKGSDVLIATPGRLEDLMKHKAVRLDAVTHLVLDEADQMLDMGFIHALKRIAAALPSERQTLLFSATMPKEIEALSKQFQKSPQKVSVAPVSATADRVEQKAYFVKRQDKPLLLSQLLKTKEVQRTIVFSRTKHGANRLVKQLDAANLDSVAIHGNKTQNQRQKALKSFKDGDCMILVATDVAARGIDIPEVSHVFNFDLPEVPEQYVHRIGRTARAGREGIAISLVSDEERHLLRSIEKLTNVKLDGQSLPDGFKEARAEAPAELMLSPRDQRKAEFRQRPDGEGRNSGEGGRRPRRKPDGNRSGQGGGGQGRSANNSGRRQGPKPQGGKSQGARPEGGRSQGQRPNRQRQPIK